MYIYQYHIQFVERKGLIFFLEKTTYIGRTEISSQVVPASEILISVVSSSSLNCADRTPKHWPGEILDDIFY